MRPFSVWQYVTVCYALRVNHANGTREKPILLLLCANRANLPRSTTDWQNSAGAIGCPNNDRYFSPGTRIVRARRILFSRICVCSPPYSPSRVHGMA